MKTVIVKKWAVYEELSSPLEGMLQRSKTVGLEWDFPSEEAAIEAVGRRGYGEYVVLPIYISRTEYGGE